MEQRGLTATFGGIWGQVIGTFSENLPRFLIFLGLLAIGWVLAYLLKIWIRRFGRGLEHLVRSRVIKSELGNIGREIGIGRSFPELLGEFVFWTVLIFFLIAATETLGLPVLSGLMSGFARYFPNILAGTVILFVGIFLAGLARKAVNAASTRAALGDPAVLGRTVQILIVLTAILIAIEQIGVHIDFLTKLIYLIVGGLLGGIALAFALGAGKIVGNLIASQYLIRTHRVGQIVKIGEIRGTIREISSTAVVVETPDGRVFIPALKFQEEASTLTSDEE